MADRFAEFKKGAEPLDVEDVDVDANEDNNAGS
jgi:hypothetical protein